MGRGWVVMFRCVVEGCPMEFTQERNMIRHVKRAHGDATSTSNNHECGVCGTRYSTRYNLSRHRCVFC